MKDILTNIREIRANLKLSQEFVASKIGLKQNSYGLIENGKRSLTYDVLSQIATVFECDVIDIITYPKKYAEKETSNIPERISVTFEVSPDKRDFLLNLVTKKE